MKIVYARFENENGFQTIEYNVIAIMKKNVKTLINEIESKICKVALAATAAAVIVFVWRHRMKSITMMSLSER